MIPDTTMTCPGKLRLLLLLVLVHTSIGEHRQSDTDLNEISEKQHGVKINKCCETNEIMVGAKCRLLDETNQTAWIPEFKTEDGKAIKVKNYRLVIGMPDCGTTQTRAVISRGNSEDQLVLLFNGNLQHLIHHKHPSENMKEDTSKYNMYSIHEPIMLPEASEPESFVHVQGKYCLDKALITDINTTGEYEYAMVCIPEVHINWKDANFVMKKILNPIFHGIGMILYLLVAIIYFVLPTLRDLAGNIITTVNLCLIVSQAADLVRVFTEFSNHISFMITDIILYISLLSAFFWLNSFGFYIWKTFKSRNVFLRVTDVRKYCYYSSVVWSCVLVMSAMAICAHFLLDTGINYFKLTKAVDDQETIGWLGIAIFFTPVAFTVIFNIFFYITTLQVIKRINIYGRIHYKLKGCFDLFLQMYLIMTAAWLFLMLSWLNFDGLIYAHIVVNLLQAILIFYVCVVRQAHVTYLLRKSCFYPEPIPTVDREWGDEMTHMNGVN